MINEFDVSILPYTPRERRAVLGFVRHQTRTQYHLDWHPVRAWLKTADNLALLAYDLKRKLMGALILSPPVEGVSWIRLISLHDDAPSIVFAFLIAQARVISPQYEIRQVAVLEIEMWLQPFLVANGFRTIDSIVHLQRPADRPLPALHPTSVTVRQAHRHELPAVAAIDQASFAPHWRMQLEDFREVVRAAASFTVAVAEGRLAGYQLATMHHDDVLHLTRLAVLPDYQGQGIGRFLAVSLLERFPTLSVTVNTQASNHASRHLYERLAFEYQDWVTPVWSMVI